MGKTLIRVDCVDQRLFVSAAPVLASGGRNEDEIEFNFCSLWDDFEKTAVFYRREDEVYHTIVRENRCVIPHEVIADDGLMYFGVFGVKGEIIRTSEIMGYRVAKGAITTATAVSDPTPDIYAQIIEMIRQIQLGSVDDEKIAEAVELYMIAHPVADNKANALRRSDIGNIQTISADSGTAVGVTVDVEPEEAGNDDKSLTNPWTIRGMKNARVQAIPGGRNLIDLNAVRKGWIDNTGTFQSDEHYRCSEPISVEYAKPYNFQLWGNSTATLWGGVAYFNADGVYIPGTYNTWTWNASTYANAVLNPPANATHVVMSWSWREDLRVKFEEGDGSEWAPAIENAADEGQIIECTFGENVYGAKVDFAAGKWYQTWKYIEITDFSTLTGRPGNGCYFPETITDMIQTDDYTNHIICSHLPTQYSQKLYTNAGTRALGITGYHDDKGAYPGQNWLYIDDGVSSTLAELKAALEGVTLRIAYRLAVPIEHVITPQIIEAMSGKMTVFSNSSSMSLIYNRAIDAELESMRGEIAEEFPKKPRDFFAREVALTVNKVLSLTDGPSLVLMHETDIHVDWNRPDVARRAIDTYTNMRAVSAKVPTHGLVSTGDWLVAGNSITNQTDVDETISRLRSHMLATHDRVYMVNGNHDGINANSPQTRNYNSASAHSADYVVREGSAPYYYADFAHVRTRCMFLDTTAHENGAAVWGVSDTQMQWVSKTLKSVPAGWNVIVFSHIAPFDATDFMTNRAEVAALFNAFHNHTGDFADVTGRVIGWFSGHQHMDYVAPSEKSLCDFPVLCTTSSGGHRWEPTEGYGYDGCEVPPFADGTVEQDAWDVIVFRPDLGKLYTVRFGAGNDREIDVDGLPEFADEQTVRQKIDKLSEEIEKLKENGDAGVAVDATLSESGKAADAAVVGQKIAEIDEAVFVTVPGKNLVNPATSVHGFVFSDGKLTSTDAYVHYETSDFIPVEKNTDYTFVVYSIESDRIIDPSRMVVLLFDENKQPIKESYQNLGSADRITFNSGNASYARVTGRTERFNNNKQRALQVEKGATFTGFEPYNDQTKKPRNSATGILYGKKWVVCGDSFTNGDYSGSGLDESEYKFQSGKFTGKNIIYPYIIAERNDMEIEKFFEGGRTLANPADGTFTNSVTNPNGDAYYQNMPEDVDYITIYLGINDSHHEEGSTGDDGEDTTGVIPLGTADDTDTTTFCGAWNVVLPWLMINRPNAHIGIIVSNGVDRVEYRDATIAAAKKWGIPYLDLNGDERCPAMIRTVNPEISSEAKNILKQKWRVSETNLHPNVAAHRFESTFIENWLRTL